jgi:hypothetical protein
LRAKKGRKRFVFLNTTWLYRKPNISVRWWCLLKQSTTIGFEFYSLYAYTFPRKKRKEGLRGLGTGINRLSVRPSVCRRCNKRFTFWEIYQACWLRLSRALKPKGDVETPLEHHLWNPRVCKTLRKSYRFGPRQVSLLHYIWGAICALVLGLLASRKITLCTQTKLMDLVGNEHSRWYISAVVW